MNTLWMWVTGMIVRSSTFRPHMGRVISDLFRQLHAVLHGTEALVYTNYPKETAVFTCLAIIFGWRTLTTAYPGSSAQQRCQCSSCISTGTTNSMSPSVQALMLAMIASTHSRQSPRYLGKATLTVLNGDNCYVTS